METIRALLGYGQAHPGLAFIAIVAAVGMYYLLNRKPKLARDADERIRELRRERADLYSRQRPLR
jgi:hypothetical protein